MTLKVEAEGKYDSRNKLNDLTGKEWLKLASSFWLSEKCADDKDAYKHPAPFLVKDIKKLISMFTKKGMRVLDPFCGSGTTLLASKEIERYGIGIDINNDYKKIATDRLVKKHASEFYDYEYHIYDSSDLLELIDNIDYIVTSPPYHNILRNKGSGLRKESKKGYRNGSRIGVDYYSEHSNDLGNKDTYEEFLFSLETIMAKCFQILNDKKYCSLIVSDFTVNKKEVCVQKDIVTIMEKIGYEFVGLLFCYKTTNLFTPLVTHICIKLTITIKI